MTAFRTLDQADAQGQAGPRSACDFNVPMEDGPGQRRHAPRARPADPPEISDKGGKVILLAHFDRPKGKRAQ